MIRTAWLVAAGAGGVDQRDEDEEDGAELHDVLCGPALLHGEDENGGDGVRPRTARGLGGSWTRA